MGLLPDVGVVQRTPRDAPVAANCGEVALRLPQLQKESRDVLPDALRKHVSSSITTMGTSHYPSAEEKARAAEPFNPELPGIKFSKRYINTAAWVPPSCQEKSDVVVYFFDGEGTKSNGVMPAQVLKNQLGERKVIVRLVDGKMKSVPSNWVMDRCLGGTEQHPWLDPVVVEPAISTADPSTRQASTTTATSGLISRQASTFSSPRVSLKDGLKPTFSANGLKESLLKRYGRLTDVWEAVDVGGNGRTDFKAFSSVCSQVRFRGDLQNIFNEITGSSSVMSLRQFKEWYPEGKAAESPTQATSRQSKGKAAKLTPRSSKDKPWVNEARLFKLAMRKNFGSLLRAWLEADSNEDDVLQFHEFVAICRRMNFIGSLQNIFEQLIGGPEAAEERDFIEPTDLDPQLSAQLDEYRKEKARAPHGSSKASDMLLGNSHASESKEERRKRKLVGFKEAMVTTFGSLQDAWRALDSNGDGLLNCTELFQGCRRLGFGGTENPHTLLKELTGGKTMLEPKMLDLDLSITSRDSLPNGSQTARARLSTPLAFKKPSPRRALSGAPPSTTAVQASNSPKRSSTYFMQPAGPSREPDFDHGRQHSAATYGEVQTLLTRNGYRGQLAGPPEDAEAFRAHLRKRYGRLEDAWKELDTRETGFLKFVDFVAGCRQVGFSGKLRQIFDELADPHLPDQINPEDLDPSLADFAASLLQSPNKAEIKANVKRNSILALEDGCVNFQHGRRRSSATTMAEVHAVVNRMDARTGPPEDAATFRSAIIKKFGKYSIAWEHLDERGKGELKYFEFVQGCRHVDFIGNFRKIFDDLTDGDEELTLEMLDRSLSRSHRRG